ncbi:MAG: YraN family protein [Planctomycetaceae bacterium]|nr:YraN family protein [Planctomycetaceae bacterium]
MKNLIRKLLGDRGEQTAARFLRRQGMKILARQYRNEFGEIDLIARHGNRLVFVEVKTRTGTTHGHPFDAVDSAKQRRIIRTALAWMKRKRRLDQAMRFDIVSIVWPDQGSEPEVTHYQDAFTADDFGQFYS